MRVPIIKRKFDEIDLIEQIINGAVLSSEGEALLIYLADHGNEAGETVEPIVVSEAIRAGYVERVTIGVPDTTLFLTAGGQDYVRRRLRARPKA